jgi:hypothetical protein
VTKTTKAVRVPPRAAGSALEASRRRVNQETVDQMAELRRQGLTFKEIGARLACSERTVRRYAGRVEPQIELPPATAAPEAQDPRYLRETLARWFSDFLYAFDKHPRPRESVRFMAEANRMIRERLDTLDPLTLGLLDKDEGLRHRFLKETVGKLYDDFRRHIQWDAQWTMQDTAASATNWIPPRERPVIYADEDAFDEDP